MNRRKFLQGLGAATVAAAIPVAYSEGGWTEVGPGAAKTFGEISIEYANDSKWGVIVNGDGATMLDVYEAISKYIDGKKPLRKEGNTYFLTAPLTFGKP